MKWPTAIDLFSGIGGMTMGLRSARYKVVGAVELCPLAAKTYSLNFPRNKVWVADIRTLDPKLMMLELGIYKGELSLLAGCPPCQGFSTVRTRRGCTVRDKRNSLILDYLRFVRAFMPKALIMENVPGLANYNLFRSTISELRKFGYTVKWGVHDASQYGVAQRRKRLILIGSKVGLPDLASIELPRQTVRQAIGDLPLSGKSGDPLHDFPEKRSKEIISLIKRIPKDGGSRTALGDDQLECHKRVNGFHDIYGRIAWDDVAPTITGGCVNPSKGRFLHPEEHRSLTLREALLLQGFPKDYKVSLERGKFAAASMIGNALPPPMVSMHAALIRRKMLPNRK